MDPGSERSSGVKNGNPLQPRWSGGWRQPPRVGGVSRWGPPRPRHRSLQAAGLSLEFQFCCRNTRARATHGQGDRNPRTQIWTSFSSFSVAGELADVRRHQCIQNLDHFTPVFPYTAPRGTPRVPAPLPLSPFSLPERDRRGDSPAWSGRGSRPSWSTPFVSSLGGPEPPSPLGLLTAAI